MSTVADRKAMIAGSPRSGTTWLGSIFDSNPETLYLHEPDVVEREPRLPFIPTADRPNPPTVVTREYFERLAGNRSVRTVFTREPFPKAYRTSLSHRMRQGTIKALRLADAVVPAVGRSRLLRVPNFGSRRPELTVVKSVDSITRLPAFVDALPEVHFFYAIRHPCGVTRSKMRGVALGRMAEPPLYSDLFTLPPAEGVDAEDAKGWPLARKIAFEWLATNEWVLDEAGGRPNVTVVNYDTLANDPLAEAPALFAAAGIPMARQTEAYLHRLLGTARGQGDYFAIGRNPAAAANEWQTGLDAKDRALVERTVAGSRVGALFGL